MLNLLILIDEDTRAMRDAAFEMIELQGYICDVRAIAAAVEGER